MSDASSKILPLESLRGVAALAVALLHAPFITPLTSNLFIKHSYLMVDFFFVLSGFVIALNYKDTLKTVSDCIQFQKKRFWRLYPLHALMLLVFLGIRLSSYCLEGHWPLQPATGAFLGTDGWALLHNALLTQAFFVDHLTFNQPSWSISTEFYTYALFALLVLVGQQWLSRFACFLIVTSLVVMLLKGGGLNGVVHWAVFRCWYSFFMGVLVYECTLYYKKPIPAWLTAGMLGCCAWAMMAWGWGTYKVFLIPVLFACLVYMIAATPKNSRLMRALSHPYAVYVGTLSYGVYLIHAAVWWLLARSVYTSKILSNSPNQSVLETVLVVIGLGLTLLLAHVSHQSLEKRFQINSLSNKNA